jgi:hypothetical protein
MPGAPGVGLADLRALRAVLAVVALVLVLALRPVLAEALGVVIPRASVTAAARATGRWRLMRRTVVASSDKRIGLAPRADER